MGPVELFVVLLILAVPVALVALIVLMAVEIYKSKDRK